MVLLKTVGSRLLQPFRGSHPKKYPSHPSVSMSTATKAFLPRFRNHLVFLARWHRDPTSSPFTLTSSRWRHETSSESTYLGVHHSLSSLGASNSMFLCPCLRPCVFFVIIILYVEHLCAYCPICLAFMSFSLDNTAGWRPSHALGWKFTAWFRCFSGHSTTKLHMAELGPAFGPSSHGTRSVWGDEDGRY